MPWANMGCATQRNLAARSPSRDLVGPRGETPRPASAAINVGQIRTRGVRPDPNGALDPSAPERDVTSEVGGPTSDRRFHLFAELRQPRASKPSRARESETAEMRAHTHSPRKHPGLLRGPGHDREVIEKASQDRRLAKAHVTVQMGGVQAAAAFYRNASTPNLIIIKSLLDRRKWGELDRLAEVCDPGTKVVAIGHVNDVVLYREVLREASANMSWRRSRCPDHREHFGDLHRSGDRSSWTSHCLYRG